MQSNEKKINVKLEILLEAIFDNKSMYVGIFITVCTLNGSKK